MPKTLRIAIVRGRCVGSETAGAVAYTAFESGCAT